MRITVLPDNPRGTAVLSVAVPTHRVKRVLAVLEGWPEAASPVELVFSQALPHQLHIDISGLSAGRWNVFVQAFLADKPMVEQQYVLIVRSPQSQISGDCCKQALPYPYTQEFCTNASA